LLNNIFRFSSREGPFTTALQAPIQILFASMIKDKENVRLRMQNLLKFDNVGVHLVRLAKLIHDL
jgi:hypothetical protein